MKLEVWIDGACEPINPGGTASYGMVVKLDGQTIHKESKVVGSGPAMSNNVAEYSALLAFIEWIGTNIPATIYSDNRMLVKQMRGEWNVNKGLYVPIHNKVWKLLVSRKLPHDFGFVWIEREENTEADCLSKQALIRVGIVPKPT